MAKPYRTLRAQMTPDAQARAARKAAAMMRPRPRWQVIQRLRRLQHDPLAPLVYIAIFGVLAYVLFIANWLTHQW